ncbi:MAG: phosphotransferase, partial [Planctomycetales bacterium]|nr:phosphotransferase [Planctomycetales bacterium]
MLPPPEPPPGTRALRSGPTTAWVREGYESLFTDGTLLGPGGFSAARALSGALPGGRGGVVALAVPGRQSERAVWRHYRRGGWLGPWLGDLFRDPWRPFREYALAERLRAGGVGTPAPLAALSHRAGLGWHRGDFLTREEPGTEDLAAFCRRTAALAPRDRARERRAAARALASALARLHEAGLYHRDLHLGNLLLRSSPGGPSGLEALVLDLDKSP